MRSLIRWLLAAAMVFAGLSHLFWARTEFQAQVPDVVTDLVPIDKDGVVVASGAVEIAFGVALVALRGSRRTIGILLACFFAAVFPGNVDQWAKGRSAFGLETDQKRFVRLFLQPVLIGLALWSTRPVSAGRRRAG